LGMRRHKHQAIVIRVTEFEFDVGQACRFQTFDGVWNLRDFLELLGQRAKVSVAQFTDQFVFVLELQINRGWRVLDASAILRIVTASYPSAANMARAVSRICCRSSCFSRARLSTNPIAHITLYHKLNIVN
jgi:hypothetical protein